MLSFGPVNLDSANPVSFTIRIPPDPFAYDEPVRVVLRVFGLRYRQSSAGAHSHTFTGDELPAHSHTFTGDELPAHSHVAFSSDGTDATPGADQHVVGGDGYATSLLVGVDSSGQASVTVNTSSDSAGTPSGTISSDSAGTPSGTISSDSAAAGIALDAAPNANLDITIDGESWKTGLGDGTEKVLVEEDCPALKSIGEHTIQFSLSSGRAGVFCQVVICY